MIYITGDTHGVLDFDKIRYFKQSHLNLTEEDYLIIVGDYGFIWKDEPDERERWAESWFEQCPWTTLFIDGNHENHHRLAKQPVEEWHGGKVHRFGTRLLHLMRGQVYEIDGKTFFTMGGAYSIDQHLRVENESWWPEEEPSAEEYKEALANLERINWKVDYVLTHDLPTLQLIELNARFYPYELTNWLEEVRQKLSYSHWFCGHHHLDVNLSEHIHVLFDNIILLEDMDDRGRFKDHSGMQEADCAPLHRRAIRGRPLYKREQWVEFDAFGTNKVGLIFVVDAYGTMEQDKQPSYDIIVYGENMLYKHIEESAVIGIGTPSEEDLEHYQKEKYGK